jgi:23S rRNA pseudouridine1911/1915/1917 synthase
VNGRIVSRCSSRVAAGDNISVSLPPDAEPRRTPILAARADLDVLFEDEYLLAINKPAGQVVHPTHAHASGTLLNALLWRGRSWPSGHRPSIVGRLDKLTSGIVMVAKTAAMHAALQRAMSAPDCDKDYLGVVYGRVNPAAGRIVLRLARDGNDRRKVIASMNVGAPSITHYERLARVAAPAVGLALLRCRLTTGRTHQIRAHLAAHGLPLVGDPVYTPPRWRDIKDPELSKTLGAFSRQALHAWRLSLVHPITRAALALETPLPADICMLLNTSGLQAAWNPGRNPRR